MLQNEQKIYMYVLLLLRLCSMMKATSPDSDRLAIGKNGHGINRIIRMNIQNVYNRFIIVLYSQTFAKIYQHTYTLFFKIPPNL